MNLLLHLLTAFLGCLKLDLGSDQFMLQVIELLLLRLQLLLHQRDLLLCLKVIVRNIQLQQHRLRILRLLAKAVNLPVFFNLAVDIGSNLLEIFLALVPAQRENFSPYDNLV